MSIEEAKKRIEELKNEPLKIGVNKGRKKIVRYVGTIKNIYPAVFTLDIKDNENVNLLSCSYSDVICGQVILKKL